MREIFGISRIARADFILARRDLKKREIRAFLRDLATLVDFVLIVTLLSSRERTGMKS